MARARGQSPRASAHPRVPAGGPGRKPDRVAAGCLRQRPLQDRDRAHRARAAVRGAAILGHPTPATLCPQSPSTWRREETKWPFGQ
eukprot:3282852-Pyramimonas_sp.AAC.1